MYSIYQVYKYNIAPWKCNNCNAWNHSQAIYCCVCIGSKNVEGGVYIGRYCIVYFPYIRMRRV